MEVRSILISGAVCLAAGALIQRQWDGKELQKVQDLLTASEKSHTVTIIKKVTRPDGTVEEDTTKTEDTIKKEIQKHIAESSKPASSPTWLISVGTDLNVDRVRGYQVQVQRQILGPVFVGVYGSTRKEVGASLGVLF